MIMIVVIDHTRVDAMLADESAANCVVGETKIGFDL